jgi:hypothetical protein
MGTESKLGEIKILPPGCDFVFLMYWLPPLYKNELGTHSNDTTQDKARASDEDPITIIERKRSVLNVKLQSNPICRIRKYEREIR